MEEISNRQSTSNLPTGSPAGRGAIAGRGCFPRNPGRWRHRSATGCLVLVSWLIAAEAHAAEPIPRPEPGDWAVSTLALLEFNRELCDRLAGQVIEKWRALGGEAEHQSSVRQYVMDKALPDMAESRAAADIVDQFLPTAREEAGAETGSSLERLQEMGKDLCDLVALPRAPLESFEAQVLEILERIEREREELGRLLLVPTEELEATLRPYLNPIRLAGFEAQNEYLDYLESQKEPERLPTHLELMQSWHQRYTRGARPVKEALAHYFQARRDNDNREMSKACRDLSSAVVTMLRQEDLFKIPTPQKPISKGYLQVTLEPLLDAYKAMRNMANECSAGKSREVVDELNTMQRKLEESSVVLDVFGLKP